MALNSAQEPSSEMTVEALQLLASHNSSLVVWSPESKAISTDGTQLFSIKQWFQNKKNFWNPMRETGYISIWKKIVLSGNADQSCAPVP